MRALGRYFLILLFAPLLACCAASETRSLVSSGDIPASKYRKIAIFIEHNSEKESSAIEQAMISAFQSAGMVAGSGKALFKGRNVNDQSKARIVQREFDAVLYVAVLTTGMREKLVPYARHDGQFITIDGETKEIDHYVENAYSLKEDGSVYESVPTLHTKCDLQDTKTNKQIWTAETIATGGTLVLFSQASKQIVDKLRTDGAI